MFSILIQVLVRNKHIEQTKYCNAVYHKIKEYILCATNIIWRYVSEWFWKSGLNDKRIENRSFLRWKICQSCHTRYYHAHQPHCTFQNSIFYLFVIFSSFVKCLWKNVKGTMQTYLLVHIIILYMPFNEEIQKTEMFIKPDFGINSVEKMGNLL